MDDYDFQDPDPSSISCTVHGYPYCIIQFCSVTVSIRPQKLATQCYDAEYTPRPCYLPT